MKQLPKGSKKLINAWAFYDWANSVYSLVITSAVFPIFYGALTITKNEQGEIVGDNVQIFWFSINNYTKNSNVTATPFLSVDIKSPFYPVSQIILGTKKLS